MQFCRQVNDCLRYVFVFCLFSMMKGEETINMPKCNLSSKLTNYSNMDNNVPSCEGLKSCHWDRTCVGYLIAQMH